MAEIELAKDLTYEKRPFRILDETERVTRSKVIKFYKVQWGHHPEEEATWEREEFLKATYPELFCWKYALEAIIKWLLLYFLVHDNCLLFML